MKNLDVLWRFLEHLVGQASRLVPPAQAHEALSVQHADAVIAEIGDGGELLGQGAVEPPCLWQLPLGFERGREIEAGERAVGFQGQGLAVGALGRSVVSEQKSDEAEI